MKTIEELWPWAKCDRYAPNWSQWVLHQSYYGDGMPSVRIFLLRPWPGPSDNPYELQTTEERDKFYKTVAKSYNPEDFVGPWVALKLTYGF